MPKKNCGCDKTALMFGERTSSRPSFGPRRVTRVSELTIGTTYTLHSGVDSADRSSIKVLDFPYREKDGQYWVRVLDDKWEHDIGLAYLGVTPYEDGCWSTRNWLEQPQPIG